MSAVSQIGAALRKLVLVIRPSRLCRRQARLAVARDNVFRIASGLSPRSTASEPAE